MVNTSKVLTVSYGTFSCTLEGFDDSFDTMKAIAEYFRDLAADDRYFGAEPPTPDAEMLARIAEREVSRRVEAHHDDGKIVLRTTLPANDAVVDDVALSDDVVSDAVEDAEIDVESDDQDVVDLTEQQEREAEKKKAEAAVAFEAKRQAREKARAAKRAEEEALAKAEADAKAEEEAKAKAEADAKAEEEAKAKAEADAKAEQEAKAKAEADAKAEQEAKAKAEADAKAEQEAKAKAEADAKAEQEAKAKAEADAKAEEEAKAKAEADAKAEQEAKAKAAEEAKTDEPDGDSVAAKLARIRAVVGKPAANLAVADFSEDEHSDELLQGQPGDTDLEDLLEEDNEVAIQEPIDATISGVMSRLAEKAAPVEEAAEENAFDEDLDVASETLEDVQDTDFDDFVEAELEETVEEAPKAPIRARVIKMKREDFEAAIEKGDIEEAEDEPVDLTPAATEASSLSPDDEDELARELAAVEAELAGASAGEPLVIEPHTLSAEDRVEPALEPDVLVQPKRGLATLSDAEDMAPDQEMDRLMDQASSELEEPDGKKRRNALGHLRAAVAAARADKKAGSAPEPVDDTSSYRDDLVSAVQPRRPVRRLTSDKNARPPLKLVEEQRVDTAEASPEVAPATPTPTRTVRPRRIKVGEANAAKEVSHVPPSEIAPEGGSFAEFAEEMGATELPDLLEAAAAFLAFVEGKEQFSRPQVMTKVRMVQEDNYSREDGLRSFGQLLRQGKIEKTVGGRFTVSDRISFKPDTRAVG